MSACNDCGATVSGPADLAKHASKVHPGHPRLRLWDGAFVNPDGTFGKETLYSPDGGSIVKLISRAFVKGDPDSGDYYVAVG